MDAMNGMPHSARCLYLFGLRPHMDYATGVVGEKRRISWQMLREVMYVEPGQGMRDTGTPSMASVRRMLERLIRAGLVTDIGTKERGAPIVFKLDLAATDFSEQKKPGKKPARNRQGEPGKPEAAPEQAFEGNPGKNSVSEKNENPAHLRYPVSDVEPIGSTCRGKQKTKYTQADRDLAEYMLRQIKTISASVRGTKEWPDTVRLMRERDGHTLDQIRAMFDYANQHDFWAANVLSPKALRKHFPKLQAQRNRRPKTEQRKDGINEWLRSEGCAPAVDEDVIDGEVVSSASSYSRFALAMGE